MLLGQNVNDGLINIVITILLITAFNRLKNLLRILNPNKQSIAWCGARVRIIE